MIKSVHQNCSKHLDSIKIKIQKHELGAQFFSIGGSTQKRPLIERDKKKVL